MARSLLTPTMDKLSNSIEAQYCTDMDPLGAASFKLGYLMSFMESMVRTNPELKEAIVTRIKVLEQR